MLRRMNRKLHLINVRVDEQTLADLRSLAAASNRPLSNYCATVLLKHLQVIAALEPKKKPARIAPAGFSDRQA